MGDETGGRNNARWRQQVDTLAAVLKGGKSYITTYQPGPLHYWRLCAADARDARAVSEDWESSRAKPSAQRLAFSVGTKTYEVDFDACDCPVVVADVLCTAANATPECWDNVKANAERVRDSLWDHRRPAIQQLGFPDGGSSFIEFYPWDDAEIVAGYTCEAHEIDDASCATVVSTLENLRPAFAKAWCDARWEHQRLNTRGSVPVYEVS